MCEEIVKNLLTNYGKCVNLIMEKLHRRKIFMLKERSIGLVILFTILTCGIYSLYWCYVTMQALDQEGQHSNMPVIAQFLLVFFLGSIGFLILGINADDNINAIKESRGIATSDNKVLWMILGFLLPIVQIALIQNEINALA